MADIRVLICDDEKEVLGLLAQMLVTQGMSVELFATSDTLVDRLTTGVDGDADILLLDIRLPGTDGFQVLEKVRQMRPELPVVMMTAYGSIDEAVHAMRLGACDFLTKPCPREKIITTVRRTVEYQLLKKENLELRDHIKTRIDNGDVVYRSARFGTVYDQALRAAQGDATIVIQGESGTGKELLAGVIHRQSSRRGKPFLLVNCAVYSESHLEGQLFGQVRGGIADGGLFQQGLLEEADGGTLLLDDIDAMPPALQAKLCNVLLERAGAPVGAGLHRRVDIRLLASSAKDLEREVAEGRFYQDLFDRLNVVTLTIPPLRDREEDIQPLAEYYLKLFARRMQVEVDTISAEACRLLTNYLWPGNVRELKNIMERAVILADTEEITPAQLPLLQVKQDRWGKVAVGNRETTLEALEREHIARILQTTGFDKRQSAVLLGIDRRTLERKIELHGIIRPEM